MVHLDKKLQDVGMQILVMNYLIFKNHNIMKIQKSLKSLGLKKAQVATLNAKTVNGGGTYPHSSRGSLNPLNCTNSAFCY